MDAAIATDAQAVRAFMAKWYTGDEESRRGFTRAERMRIEHENPMHLDFYAELTLNGRKLRSDSSSSGGWAPIKGYDNEARALRCSSTTAWTESAAGSFGACAFPGDAALR